MQDTMQKEEMRVDWDSLLIPKTVSELMAGDRRAECNCPMPYVHRKWHKALGIFSEIRLCCMARLVEEKLGLDPGTIYKVVDFEPTAEWDCDELIDDAESGKTKRGAPPQWLKQRMDNKHIKIKNLTSITKAWGRK